MASDWEKTWLWSSHIILGEHFACKLPSLLYAFIMNINLCLFSYLTADSSKLLSHPMIFPFCASHPPPWPPSVGKGGRGGEREQVVVVWFGELLWEE